MELGIICYKVPMIWYSVIWNGISCKYSLQTLGQLQKKVKKKRGIIDMLREEEKYNHIK